MEEFCMDQFKVDYISINIHGEIDEQPIIDYLEKRDFIYKGHNIFLESGFEELEYNNSCYIQKYRRGQTPGTHWTGTQLHFPGSNGDAFYQEVKKDKINWNVFSNNGKNQIKLSRIDVCYELKATNPEEHTKMCDHKAVADFMYKCFLISKKAGFSVELGSNKKGMYLKVRHRKSPQYLRVYQKKNKLRFEYEKKKLESEWHTEFFSGTLDNFEKQILESYVQVIKSSLELRSPYLQWFFSFVRKFRAQPSKEDEMVTTFLRSRRVHSSKEASAFYTILQFITFTRKLRYLPEAISENTSEGTVDVNFTLSSFLEFIRVDPRNQYRRNQVRKVFKELSKDVSLLKNFKNEEFRSLWRMVYCEFDYKKTMEWVHLSLPKKLMDYSYEFCLPSSFLSYDNSFELKVKLRLLQEISRNSTTKQFDLLYYRKLPKVSSINKRKVQESYRRSLIDLQESIYFKEYFIILYKKNRIAKVHSLDVETITQASLIYLEENVLQNIEIRSDNFL